MLNKKVFVFLVGLILLVGIAGISVAKDNGDDGNSNSGKSVSQSDDSESEEDNDSENEDDREEKEIEDDDSDSDDDKEESETEIESENGKIKIKSKTQNSNGENEFEYESENGDEKLKIKEKIKDSKFELKIEGRNVEFKNLDNETLEIIAGKINARTGLNLTVEELKNDSGLSVLKAKLSNGNETIVRVMPDEASEIALDKLRAKCEDRNCSVELKEVGEGKKSRLVYEIETEKNASILLIFKKKMKVKAEVDAETGEIITLRKPWWSFVSKEKHETDDENEIEIEENNETSQNLTNIKKITICHIPPGNEANKHTITISQAALKAHLDHGDYVGICKNQTIPGNETVGNETNATLTLGVNLIIPSDEQIFNTTLVPLEFIVVGNATLCYYDLDNAYNVIGNCSNLVFNTTEGKHSIFVGVNNTDLILSNVSEKHNFTVILPLPIVNESNGNITEQNNTENNNTI